MTDTQSLIDQLAASARPVRAALWLGSALLIIAVLALIFGLRDDFAAAQRQPGYMQGLAASVATGLLAALAAFMAGLPDRSRLWALLPLPASAVWLASVGYGCLTNWIGLTLLQLFVWSRDSDLRVSPPSVITL